MASSNFNTVLKLHMLKGQYIQVLKEKTNNSLIHANRFGFYKFVCFCMQICNNCNQIKLYSISISHAWKPVSALDLSSLGLYESDFK